MGFEVNIIKSLQSIRSDFWDAFFNVYAYLGSVWAVLVLFLMFFFLYNKKVGVAFLITEGLAYFSCWLLKNIIQRPRPFVSNFDIANIGGESGFSMPSGHLTATIVIAIFLFYIVFASFKKKGRIFYSIAISVFVLVMIIDRMYLGVHYLTDTVAGIALGGIWCAVALLALPPLGKFWDNFYFKLKQKLNQKKELKKNKTSLESNCDEIDNDEPKDK